MPEDQAPPPADPVVDPPAANPVPQPAAEPWPKPKMALVAKYGDRIPHEVKNQAELDALVDAHGAGAVTVQEMP